MKKLILTLQILQILFMFVFIFGCTQKQVQFESELKKDITNVVHTIDTEFKWKGKVEKLKCTSFHIGNGFVVTCTHGIKIEYKTIRTSFGYARIPVKGADYKYYISNNELKFIGSIEDITLFWTPALIGTPSVQI